MPTEKKLTKEDTWKSADLTKHMRDTGHGDTHSRLREEREKRARDKNKEEERESRRARGNKDEERDSRMARDNKDERHIERKRGGDAREKERKREGGAEKETERRRAAGVEREKERKREGGAETERRRERHADTRGPDKDPQRHGGERERHRDRTRERERGDEREKRREEREKDRKREEGRERDREEKVRHREREHLKEGDRQHGKEQRERRVEEPQPEEREDEKNEEIQRDRDRRKKTKEEEEGGRGAEEERKRRREKEERRQRKEEGGGSDEERRRRHRERRQKQIEDGGVSTDHRDPGETKTGHHGDRDTGERDRRRAGRHPVLPEPEPPGPRVGTATPERKAAKELESTQGELAYEDDFEEYEDDFEEVDDSGGEEEAEDQKEVRESPSQEIEGERSKEVEAIQRAMEEENRRAGTAQSGRRTGRTEEEIRPPESERTHRGSPPHGSPRGPPRGKFIDFVAAKQREINTKVASKQKKRSVELLRLVELDSSPTFSLLDLPPLSQYDVYIKSFGNTNTKQAYVQCCEDDVERDVQTDLIEVQDKWTQHPADHTGACRDPGRSQETPDENTAQINIDSQHLATFLHSAAQVMSVLLEEDHAERQSLRTTRTQADALSFSEGNLQLNTQLPFLYGRPCSLLLFSPARRQTVLSVHGPLDQPGAVRLDSCTLLCVWNIWEPSRPQKILLYESEVRCCCFSPGSSALVLAGTSDGSLVLWDLREPARGHNSMNIGGAEWTFRQPTFSTDAVLSTLGHHAAVNTIEVLPSSFSSSTTSSSTAADPQTSLLASEESSGSFQLASLDERGVLNLWVVLELTAASLAGSQTDLGLRPGGKVKMLHSSRMPAVEREGADMEALRLHFLPSDANHFLLTTTMGVVLHGTAHGFRSPPRDYRSQDVGLRPLHVTSVHFSPFNPQLFLAGCADGSMRLHIVSSHWPLAEWSACQDGGAPEVGVVSVRWSQSRPVVFCVLDSASRLHVWDLSRDTMKPVIIETLQPNRVTAMEMFGSSTSSQQNSYSGVALAHHSGKLQLHYFNPNFSSANRTEEEDILKSMMHQPF